MGSIVCKGGANSSFIILPHVDRLHLGHEAYRVTNRYQGRMLGVPKVEYHKLMLLEFHKILEVSKSVCWFTDTEIIVLFGEDLSY